jgi:hypothetical protein
MARTWEELEGNEKQKRILRNMGTTNVKLKDEEKEKERK